MTVPVTVQNNIHSAESTLWRVHFVASQALFDAVQKDLQQQIPLLLMHYEILSRLAETPEKSLRMSELAESAQSSRSRLSHAVSRLQDDGFVVRQSCPSDKRGSYAALTPSGKALYMKAKPFVEDSLKQHLASLLTKEEQEHLMSIQSKVLNHLINEHVVPSECSGKSGNSS